MADNGMSVEEVCEAIGLKTKDVMYMAEQRALRSVYAFNRGINLNKPESEVLSLNPKEMLMLIQFQAAAMDALCIGWRARNYENNTRSDSGERDPQTEGM